MKRVSFFLFLSISFLALSCEKENLTVKSGSGFENEVSFRSEQLNNGVGVQKINGNQTNEDLERGVAVTIPFFSEEAVSVKTGTWVTLRFSIREAYSLGTCPGELTDAEVADILADAIQGAADLGIEVEFDGEPIAIASYFRTEGTELLDVSAQDGTEFCVSSIPWLFYVNPQSAGDHEFKCRVEGVEYTRTISWVPGDDG